MKISERESNIEDIKDNNINFLYYISSASHLSSMLEHGILSRNKALDMGVIKKDISLREVQYRREKIIINGISLHEYACLYFCPTNPMLYRVQKENDDIIIIAIDKSILLDESALFSDGNASSNNTKFNKGTEFLKELPWTRINTEYWDDPNFDSDHYSHDNLQKEERKRIKCAEVLIYQKVPPNYIQGIFCNSLELKEYCISITRNMLPKLLDQIFFDQRMFYNQ